MVKITILILLGVIIQWLMELVFLLTELKAAFLAIEIAQDKGWD